MLDTKIINALIVDGTGQPAYRGDVGIRNGCIAALGSIQESATETIDARGRVVSPGFIDVHTHYDAQICWDQTLSPSCYHGVTTVLSGNCGFTVAPMTPEAAEYLVPMLARVEGMPIKALKEGLKLDWSSFGSYLKKFEGKVAINVGFMAGHSTIRRVVMGARAVSEKATDDDLQAMKKMLAKCIEEGALGFSTTRGSTHNDAEGKPVPSRHASREELMELASVVSKYEGTTLELLPGIDFNQEIYDLLTDFSLAGKRPVNWNMVAFNGATPDQVIRTQTQLGASTYARSKGAEVIALTLPFSATIRVNMFSGFLLDSLAGWADLFQLPITERINKLKDSGYRKQLDASANSEETGVLRMFADWGKYTVVETFSDKNKGYVGKTISEIADLLHKPPFDVFLDISIEDGLKTSYLAPFSGEDKATYALRASFWRDDRTIVGASDAGAHNDMIDTFMFSTKVLEKGVREYGVISLEEAVHQLTEVPAQKMGIRERGVLREGWHADLVIFDPQTIAAGPVHTRFDFPAGEPRLYAEAEGISHVIVNGKTIIRDNEYLGVSPGTVLHSGRDTFTVQIGAH
jgi:N-acyl-D-aspartate/D-glutamate deacylase